MSNERQLYGYSTGKVVVNQVHNPTCNYWDVLVKILKTVNSGKFDRVSAMDEYNKIVLQVNTASRKHLFTPAIRMTKDFGNHPEIHLKCHPNLFSKPTRKYQKKSTKILF